jgi:hypothetical protein
MKDKYKLRYKVESGEFDGEFIESRDDDSGFCDAIILHSIVGKFGEGPMSHMTISMDGHTKEPLVGNQLFRCWAMMAKELSEREDVPPHAREVCEAIWEAHRQSVLAARGL